ncbi:MAG: hypothetical protein KGJ57_18175 [Sphingomonadales bacterium]|nr:hypothetical protein [Sphingomonadales bacterium]MDE2171326.1 hypothetical protein [Sphingomonadales bacterium]
MFVVTHEPKFTHTVKVQVPTDKGHEVQSFKATFKVLPVIEEGDATRSAKETLEAALCGVSDLVDDANQAVTYTDELRDQLIAIPYVRIALLDAYIKGVTKAPAGN